jgi:hypothetical protein
MIAKMLPGVEPTSPAVAPSQVPAELTDERIYSIYETIDWGEIGAGIEYARAIEREVRLSAVREARNEAQWISVAERLPAVGELVLVYSPPTKYDHPGDVRIGFDCIDPNDDDASSWLNHNEHYEHFCCVAKPEGSIGPSAEAPYTHWMPLPEAPAASKEGGDGE